MWWEIRDTAHHTLLLRGYILRLNRHFEPPKVPEKAADFGGLADFGGRFGGQKKTGTRRPRRLKLDVFLQIPEQLAHVRDVVAGHLVLQHLVDDEEDPLRLQVQIVDGPEV